MAASEKDLVLYDGVCALCNGLVRFLLPRDRDDRFRFAALQSPLAQSLLARHGRDPQGLDTVYVVVTGAAGERLLSRSDAVLHLLRGIGGVWRLAAVVRLVPRVIRDAGYRLVARSRYRLFGRYETCLVPEPRWRAKFVDGEGGPTSPRV
jgi:predicted DCC family thiol-disulfide oxidoreductase YuxK